MDVAYLVHDAANQMPPQLQEHISFLGYERPQPLVLALGEHALVQLAGGNVFPHSSGATDSH